MIAVVGALLANALIAVLKLGAAFITGSSSMMAEAFHSVADTTNQVFLLLGLRFFKRPASKNILSDTGKSVSSGLS
jgi:divalent metal cation (Fe/Co/Zn/Cd) transporter